MTAVLSNHRGRDGPPRPAVSRQRVQTVIALFGEQDIASVARLRIVLLREIRAADVDLVIDFSDVTFVDAATVGALVEAGNLLSSSSRTLTVRALPPCALRLLVLCDLAERFHVDNLDGIRRGIVQRRADEMLLLHERDRIASDLNDRVIQKVFAAGLSLQLAAQMSGEPAVVVKLIAIGVDLDVAIREVRSAVVGHCLRPSPLD